MEKEADPDPEDLDPSNWVEKFGDALYRFACFRVNDEAQAENLVQDTFLAGLKSVDRFRGGATVKTWLTGILKNKIIDHYRKSGRTQSFGDLTSFYDGEFGSLFRINGHWKAEAALTPPEERPEQQMNLDRKDFWHHLEKCLAKVPERIRQVYMLREIDDFSSEEICDRLNISRQNLWTILHRARMALRQCLEENSILPSLAG